MWNNARMVFTDSFRRQHQEILQTATELSGLLQFETLPQNSQAVVALLAKLAGKVSAHLIMEDKVLYPKLYQHPNEEIRATARKFFNEMGNISQVFKSYSEKWLDTKAIETAPEVFITETNDLFSALSKRINSEDNILYPMADR